MQSHDSAWPEWLSIWRRKRGIMHHIQAQARQYKWEPELLDDEFIRRRADHSIKRVLQGYEFWMNFAREKEDITNTRLAFWEQEQVFGNFRGVTKYSGRPAPDTGQVNANA